MDMKAINKIYLYGCLVHWWSAKSEPQVEALNPMLYDDEGSVLFQNVLILLPLKIILCDATFLGTDFWCILERLCIFQNSSDGLWLENKCPPIAVSFDVLKYRYAKPAVFLLCLMELVDICFQYVLFRHPSHQVLNFMAARRVATAMWVLRFYLIFLSIQYMFFCSAFDMNHYFTRAMLANGIICALRLHQRIPEFRLSRQHLGQVMAEDSGHYLMFSFIFLFGHPISIALVPITVFALMHACSFTRQMLDVRGSNSFPPLRKIINHVAKHQNTLFRFIAMNEIIIMPTTVAMALGGKTMIVTPFLYYRFLTYRYLSRRNPYSRLTFYELHLAIKYMTESPNCPSLLRSLLFKVIAFTMRLAPSTTSFQGQQQETTAQS